MPDLFILVLVMAVASLAILGLHIRSEQARSKSSSSESFVGGGTWCPRREAASRVRWPLVRLDIGDSGVMVGPTSRWLRWAVPHVEMLWCDITSAESRPTGVRFNLKGANSPALLFQLHRDAVLAALRRRPVDLRA